MSESRIITEPQPGMWAVRLVAGGPEVAAGIFRRLRRAPDPAAPANIQGECNTLEAYLDGRPVRLAAVWERRGRPIDRAEYDFLLADRAWAKRHAPHLPEARPTERADLRLVPPIKPPPRRA